MTERIYYDDDPAATAAERWVTTKCGRTTIRQAYESDLLVHGIKRAFRTGYLLGQKATKSSGPAEEEE